MMNKLQGKLARLREAASDEFAGPPFDSADQGCHDVEEAVTLGLADNEQHLLEEIDAALARIEEGGFGRCEQCGHAIARERLQAVAYSRYCGHCVETLKNSKAGG